MNEVVIDIETVPGTLTQPTAEIMTRLLAKKKDKDQSKFCALTWAFGRIVCIGISIDGKVQTLMGNETDILMAFWTLVGRKTDEFSPMTCRYITFNGKDFDIPFINFRSALTGIEPSVEIPRRRYYKDRHFDVMEELSNYFNGLQLSLKDYCTIFDIRNTDETDGADIHSLWLKGDREAIEKHCASDVRYTLELYKRIKNCC
jgi:predicted PolB exonuclease-like 3'-5' exonuclease